ncbi:MULTISPECIES: TetR/AcrR family transcriptional regulator [unclassified Rhodococcus (in: high G+C Gram-positive bacteria)]|uniref:TetR/AcrR family transcriptional regulator n=1 Tax=unclassified Rhodococcus (in: high G+C Gram-positive bacteria) TaxID=192944 RepID=UPI0007BC6BB0|nr:MULTISPECIES: TetR/AcrR family transcriptional regulator [unclassified Rhodococcus (in: high G+C Gram-positive bacteria)]KZF03054.1 TetR family transcriptional regulator [Rhodococcus sp. EPR-279]KZF09678.1 TetR family transcriptional regulator [Rhodococcus sp. EPR-147]
MDDQDQGRLDSRAKILIAACTMISEDPASTLSVRSVASRAGVSMGSLRHHFPTQRALRAAVLDTIYNVVEYEDDIISDKSIPARDRLVRCLRQPLSMGVGDEARRAWTKFFDAFIAPEPTDDIRAAYSSFVNEGQRRMERWLNVLAEEGALLTDDVEGYARFLNTVLNGLSLERAAPIDGPIVQRETATLYAAVDAILRRPP